MKLAFFVKEGFRALRRSAAPSIAATVTIAITVLLLGVLIPVLQTTQGKTNEVRSQIELRVFLFDDATDGEIQRLQQRIGRIRHVSSVEFISKAEALRLLKRRLKDKTIVDELASNPLPASFKVKLDDPGRLQAVHSAIEPPDARGKPAPISPIIDEIKDSKQEAGKILRVTSALKLVLVVITGLLLLASLLLIANTIRLSIYARRREVEVMRLVGATDWFIRWPFVIEGVVVGFLGGIVAVSVLWIGKETIVDPLSDNFALVAAQHSIAFPKLVLLLIASATLVSALGSGITLRRFLQI